MQKAEKKNVCNDVARVRIRVNLSAGQTIASYGHRDRG
jgi:hypothetical protein